MSAPERKKMGLCGRFLSVSTKDKKVEVPLFNWVKFQNICMWTGLAETEKSFMIHFPNAHISWEPETRRQEFNSCLSHGQQKPHHLSITASSQGLHQQGAGVRGEPAMEPKPFNMGRRCHSQHFMC